MRKNLGFVLLALGAALLAVGVVTTAWAPGVVKKTPLDVDTVTYLEGTASKLGAESRPIQIRSHTRTDSEASDDANAVFVQTQCVIFTDKGETDPCPRDPEDPDVVSIPDPDRFVTDRTTALAVSEEGYVDEEFVVAPHDGIVNKFPFDTEPETYPYWDGLTERSWPAEYVGEEEVAGVATYHFRVTIQDAPAKVAPPTETMGTYSNEINLWVEPRTGSIIDQTQDQQRSLTDGTQVLDLQAEFTDEQVETFAADAEDNIARLDLTTRTAPLVGFIGGGVLFLAGLALVLTGRRRQSGAHGARSGSSPREPVSV